MHIFTKSYLICMHYVKKAGGEVERRSCVWNKSYQTLIFVLCTDDGICRQLNWLLVHPQLCLILLRFRLGTILVNSLKKNIC